MTWRSASLMPTGVRPWTLKLFGSRFCARHGPYEPREFEFPWGFAYEMRNALSHGYFTVDHAIVWQTIQNDLPKLRGQISALI